MKLKLFWIVALILPLILSTGMSDPVDSGGGNLTEAINPDRIFRTDSEFCYGISREYGFMASSDSGNTWEERNEGLPKALINKSLPPRVRFLTALGIDPASPERVAVVTTTKLYLSGDYGQTWQAIDMRKHISGGLYLTSVALSPDKKSIAVGTSFAGIYETKNQGLTWSNISQNLKYLYLGAGFWEEIAALAYQPESPNRLIFSCGFGRGLYQLSPDRKSAEKIDLTGLDEDSPSRDEIHQLQFRLDPVSGVLNGSKSWLLQISGRNGDWLYSLETKQLIRTETCTVDRTMDPAKTDRLNTASGKQALYLRWDSVLGKRFDKWIGFIKEKGLNAMVVDFKDDFGLLTYNTKLSMPRQVGAVRDKSCIVIEDLLQKAKENGIYVIGRVVVFQDPCLYRYQNNKYAVWDKYDNRPWGKKEFWVDPFCPEVWEYNLSIAEELQELGVDEIQFDYIRFATDGDISRILCRYQPEGAEKMDALESFLAAARERISIPISTDLYGFNCMCRVDNYNGQNIDLFANYVDVICPMYYPSHFPASFLRNSDYLERARQIYREGGERACSIVDGRSIIRPYVQAFLIGGELRMKELAYSKYLSNQIEGITSSPASGFTLWDYSNRYYMVTQPLLK
jgi:hypothetical protein